MNKHAEWLRIYAIGHHFAPKFEEIAAAIDELAEYLDDLANAAASMPLYNDNLCQGTLDFAVEKARALLQQMEKGDE